MNTGAVIYATDGDIRYTQIAQECALRVEQYLGIPAIIVEGSKIVKSTRNWADCKGKVQWRNGGRCNALDDSPYERTILLDADYWIASDCLKSCLDSSESFLAHNTRMYINEDKPKIETFGVYKTEMWWATVCVFDRSEYTQDIFDAWRMIEENYTHYANLFNFNKYFFRNDFALSLALLLCNGGERQSACIPWPLLHVPDSCNLDLQKHTWNIEYPVNQIPKRITIKNTDLHIMGKRNLEKLCEIQ